MAWLRKGPNKDITEDDVGIFLLAWERGNRKGMSATAFLLAPFLPQVILGSAPEPTGFTPFFEATDHPRFVMKEMHAVVADCPNAVGLSLFADIVNGLIDQPMRVPSTTLQKSVALVVKNCSGVGKTVGSLAVCSRLNSPDGTWYFSPLYLSVARVL